MKKRKIIIDIPEIFVSVNQQYIPARVGKRIMPRLILSPFARAYKESVGWEAKRVYKGEPIAVPVKITIEYWFTSKRQDLLNDKLTFDALENIVIFNDRQIHEFHAFKKYAKYPRTKIIIEEL